MENPFEKNLAPDQVEVEGALSNEETLKFAQKAVDNINEELSENEKFPGAKAYTRVMEVIVSAGANEKLIDEWQTDYEELEEKFQTEENPEVFVKELKKILQDALDGVIKSADNKS